MEESAHAGSRSGEPRADHRALGGVAVGRSGQPAAGRRDAVLLPQRPCVRPMHPRKHRFEMKEEIARGRAGRSGVRHHADVPRPADQVAAGLESGERLQARRFLRAGFDSKATWRWGWWRGAGGQLERNGGAPSKSRARRPRKLSSDRIPGMNPASPPGGGCYVARTVSRASTCQGGPERIAPTPTAEARQHAHRHKPAPGRRLRCAKPRRKASTSRSHPNEPRKLPPPARLAGERGSAPADPKPAAGRTRRGGGPAPTRMHYEGR